MTSTIINQSPISITDIKHVYYINLESRPDRKTHVELQLKSLGFADNVVNRFNAIQLKNGALGCSMSHLKLLEMAKAENWSHIMIVEDDILFTDPTLFIAQFNKFLAVRTIYDVAIIAGNNMPPFKNIDETCIQVTRCQTTTGYLVLRHYYDRLIANFREGISRLIKEPHNHAIYAIDKYWFKLQQTDTWYLIIPLTVTQREDYSNIEKRTTNYSRVMLDLDKEAFIKWQKEQQTKASLSKMILNG